MLSFTPKPTKMAFLQNYTATDFGQLIEIRGIMGLEYRNLDIRTRAYMVEEIQMDIRDGKLYISGNLTLAGKTMYPGLLLAAAQSGDDDSLATNILPILNSHEELRAGEQAPRQMRLNAHEMLAQGEFNRFYIRGLCRRAKQDGIPNLVIYRAKQVSNPRPESNARIGKTISVDSLLLDIRANPGSPTMLAIPSGPNSGLSLQLP